jgi:hypothetical protein
MSSAAAVIVWPFSTNVMKSFGWPNLLSSLAKTKNSTGRSSGWSCSRSKKNPCVSTATGPSWSMNL